MTEKTEELEELKTTIANRLDGHDGRFEKVRGRIDYLASDYGTRLEVLEARIKLPCSGCEEMAEKLDKPVEVRARVHLPDNFTTLMDDLKSQLHKVDTNACAERHGLRARVEELDQRLRALASTFAMAKDGVSPAVLAALSDRVEELEQRLPSERIPVGRQEFETEIGRINKVLTTLRSIQLEKEKEALEAENEELKAKLQAIKAALAT
jgi:hypothetical protein